ncbi:MAG: hypothetical protein BWY89_00704 [Bacteroidetes bacterium ADurb.BinA012]|nr:MAG: hypothetical protein BWY89_00704 [Bacteroidetes bacterium ADurb.BinA012]
MISVPSEILRPVPKNSFSLSILLILVSRENIASDVDSPFLATGLLNLEGKRSALISATLLFMASTEYFPLTSASAKSDLSFRKGTPPTISELTRKSYMLSFPFEFSRVELISLRSPSRFSIELPLKLAVRSAVALKMESFVTRFRVCRSALARFMVKSNSGLLFSRSNLPRRLILIFGSFTSTLPSQILFA